MSSERVRPTEASSERDASSVQMGATSSGGAGVQLKQSLRGLDFGAQEARLSPVQLKGAGGDGSHVHEAAQRGISGGGGALPHQDAIQKSFGAHDVSGVKAHVGAEAAEATKAMGAEAYAKGSHVAFSGQPSLHTVAHEAAHVVQQRAGVSLSGGVGRDGDPYEQHADAVADLTVQGKSAEGLLDEMSGSSGTIAGEGSVQLMKHKGTPVDIAALDADAVKENIGRFFRQQASKEQGDDTDYEFEPADIGLLKGREAVLKQQATTATHTTLVGELGTQLSALAAAADFEVTPPWEGHNPGAGATAETMKGGAMPADAATVVAAWRSFLGAGAYSHKHPRTGGVDATRLVSADGKRSIRYGDHEKTSTPNLHHYHEETWTWDSNANTLSVANEVQRVPVK